ncbi:hypothetical protein [Mycolicibacterium gilvum]|uniref:hypothetical protein n=1 Tax=Mycolicibacterium gilvum TaxID=1804 RepID=UPI0011C06919|nr:hypothetical protein [Mycolicibacterium gilvum]MCV7056612.1 hypothetical protein [Mycolicibacterium gilvum]
MTPTNSESTPVPSAQEIDASSLATSFTQMAATLPAGDVGVTIYDGQRITQYGSWTDGAAWSTIKVPLSIAALRADPEGAEPLMRQAISQSDNSSADQMWALLGDPAAAAAAVEDVLREGGDAVTTVQQQQVRPPYSSYGQTTWSEYQTAIFAFNLPCVPGAEPVLASMRAVGGNQQWGLANFAGTAVKGGWGPGTDGGYLVRQLAVVNNATGILGISLAARPHDGSIATGEAMLNFLGAWIDQTRNNIVGGQC